MAHKTMAHKTMAWMWYGLALIWSALTIAAAFNGETFGMLSAVLMTVMCAALCLKERRTA